MWVYFWPIDSIPKENRRQAFQGAEYVKEGMESEVMGDNSMLRYARNDKNPGLYSGLVKKNKGVF